MKQGNSSALPATFLTGSSLYTDTQATKSRGSEWWQNGERSGGSPRSTGRTGSGQLGLREAESAGRPRGQAALTQQQSRAGLATEGKPEWGDQGKTDQCDNTSSLVLLAKDKSCLSPWALNGSDTTLQSRQKTKCLSAIQSLTTKSFILRSSQLSETLPGSTVQS